MKVYVNNFHMMAAAVTRITDTTESSVCSPYFAIPSDPSFIHPVTDFPPLTVFDSKVEHAALVVPAKRAAELRKTLRSVLLHRPKTKAIYPVDNNNDPNLRKMVLKSNDDILWKDPAVVKLLEEDPSIQVSTHSIEVSYADWTVDEVLNKILPFDEVPSSFEIVGHIAHVNLKDEWLAFQYIIGKVILDKNQPRIKTVVNKEGHIDTKYRTFGMKVIAGSSENDWSIVTMKEEGCTFQLDFQQVYWNSRLAGEHRRLVHDIRTRSRGCTVADIMAGVGPFAVPLTAAKLNPSHIRVHANDLNPASYKYLNVNSTRNKCGEFLNTYNMDGRAFVHWLQEKEIDFDHAIMNLPASAPEFLDAFRGFQGKVMPEIHVHCFAAKLGGGQEEAIARCSRALGCQIENPHVHLVRDVAPKKNMLCISFVLPHRARLLPKINLDDYYDEPEPKRTKIDDGGVCTT